MHLAHPSLSTSGRKRGKTKFRNAAEARRARELDASWQDLQTRWGVNAAPARRAPSQPLTYSLSTPPGRSSGHQHLSRDTGHVGAVTGPAAHQYTGTEMLGLGQMHKSNSVPVFRRQDAQDIAHMRR
jgi:hypothetical protein